MHQRKGCDANSDEAAAESMQQMEDQRRGRRRHVVRTEETPMHFEQRADRQVADTAKGNRSGHHVQDEQAGTPHRVTVPPLASTGDWRPQIDD